MTALTVNEQREAMLRALAEALANYVHSIFGAHGCAKEYAGQFRVAAEHAFVALEPLIAEREEAAHARGATEGFKMGRARAVGLSCACRIDDAGNEVEVPCEMHAAREEAARRGGRRGRPLTRILPRHPDRPPAGMAARGNCPADRGPGPAGGPAARRRPAGRGGAAGGTGGHYENHKRHDYQSESV